MQFPLPFIFVLVIPSGAGPNDPRVVIGDPTGSIGIFDSNGNLVGLLTSEGPAPNNSPGFFVFDPTDNEDYVGLETIAGFPGITFSDDDFGVVGRWSEGHSGTPGSTARAFYQIDTPGPVGRNRARLTMTSESDNGTIDPVIDLTASGSAITDVRQNGRSLPRGILEGGYLQQTANDAARAAGVNTNATVSPTEGLISGRLYRVSFHSQINVGTAAAVYAVSLDYNGTLIGRLGRWSAAETAAGSTTIFCSGVVEFVAAADDASPVFTVQNNPASGGTITLIGNNTDTPRTLSVEDLGVP